MPLECQSKSQPLRDSPDRRSCNLNDPSSQATADPAFRHAAPILGTDS
jgi:hypothetical protein